MSRLNASVGKRIKQLREGLGYSQTGLAHTAGTTPAAVSQWENGTRKPSFDSLRKIAAPLHTTTDYLLGKERIDVAEILANPTAAQILQGFDDLPQNDQDSMLSFYGYLKSRREANAQ